MKTKTIYEFPKEGYFSLKFPEMPLKISISCDGSNAIISTSKKLSLLYFRKLFNKEKLKKMLKQEYCDLYKNIGPIEMHPFFDEKEYFAGAYENSIFVLKVSKNSLNINEARKMTNQHYTNIRFLAWQYKQNGLLASTSEDKVINFYDLRAAKNPVYKTIDDAVVKCIKFSISNHSLLATGYDKRLKIWDLKKQPFSVPIIVKEIFDGGVDIIEWHSTQNLILCGSKQNNIVKIFSVKDTLELIQEIKIKDVDEKDQNNPNSQKILKAYFIQGNGIVVICEKKAFLYYLGNNYSDAILDQVVEFEHAITNFKIMTNNLNNHYFVYTDRENNFVTKQYVFDESISPTYTKKVSPSNNVLPIEKERSFNNSSGNKRLQFMKEIENMKRKYQGNISIETKMDRNVFIFKLFQDLITIKIKVTYNENYPKVLPSIEFENKYESFLMDRTLISNISNEISTWQQKESNIINTFNANVLEKLITNLMKIISNARIHLEEYADDNAKRLLKKQGKVVTEPSTILPYVRTCAFTWGPKGQILTFHYNKIDFKQLKQSDKTITNFNNLEDWIKFCEANDNRNKFSKSENKLIEEDTDVIVTEKLRSIVDWKSMIELEDNFILNSINKIESLPNLFMNNNNNNNCFIGNPDNENLSNFSNFAKNNKINFSLATHIGGTDHFDNLLTYTSLDLINSNSTGTNNFTGNNNLSTFLSSSRKKCYLVIHQLKNIKCNFILENLKLKLLSKDHFFASINYLLQSMMNSEVTHLLDVLNMLNFNINSIIDPSNTSELLVKHYKHVILTTIKTLEKNKNYEYLYICILLITSRLFDNVIRDVLKVPSLIVKTDKDDSNNKGTNGSVNMSEQNRKLYINGLSRKFIKCDFKRISRLQTNFSQHSIVSDRVFPKKTIEICPSKKLSYANLQSKHRSSSFDESGRYDPPICDDSSEVHLNDQYDYNKIMFCKEEDDDDQDSQIDNISATNGINFINENSLGTVQRDLIQVFGDHVLSKFIDFLYFYSNELYRINRIVERAELIKFLYLISSKMKINKFKNIIENSYVNLNPLAQARNKRVYSTIFYNMPKEIDSLYNRFKSNDEKVEKIVFKTKLINCKEFCQCDICGERLKIGTLSLYSPYFNVKGHYEHVMDFIQNAFKINIVNKPT